MAEIQIVCPTCSGHREDPAYINTEKLIGHCFRCGTVWRGKEAQRLLGPRQGPRQFIGANLLPLMPALMSAWESTEASHCLYARGITPEMCPMVEYDPDGRKLFFRIWSPSPEFVPSWHRRGIDEDGFWAAFPGTYRQHYVFGHATEGVRSLCLVEGIWDALRVGANCLALLGTSVSDTHLAWFRLMKPKPRVLLYLDRDEAGQSGEVKIKKTLQQYGFKVERVGFEQDPKNCPHDSPQLQDLRERLAS